MSSALQTDSGTDMRSPRGSHRFWLAVALVALLGLALRIPSLTRSVWLDEAYSAWFASRSLHDLWTVVPTYEGHPPLYYTLLKGWTALFGTSEVALRGPTVLASLLTIVLVAVSGRVLKAGPTGDKVALLAAFFLALNFGNIRYAQQARPYALETLTASFAVLGALLVVRLLLFQSDRQRSDFRALLPGIVMLSVGTGATLWLHNTALFIAFGIWVGLGLSLLLLPGGNRWHKLLAVILPGLGALLIWSPYIPTYVRQVTGFSGTPFWIVFTAHDLLSAWYLIAGTIPSLILIAFFGVAGVVLLWRLAPPLAVLLVTVLLLPWASVLLVSYLAKPIFIDRLFAWMAPSVLALVAFGIVAGLTQPLLRLAAIVLVGSLCAFSTGAYYTWSTEDWRGIIRQIAEQSEPGDLIIGNSSEVYLPFAYYGPGVPNLPDLLVVPGPFPVIDPTHRRFTATPVVSSEDRPAVQRALAVHSRVWLVELRSDLFDPEGIVAKQIAGSRKLQHSFEQVGIRVTLFQ